MKFRSDFVTNSSSSSYVVSFKVHSVDNTDIPMTLSKNQRNKEREENASYPWKHSRNHILKAIMNCKTVGELTDLLVEECEKGLYDRSWQGDWLKDLKEDNPAEYEEYINKIQKRIKEFKRKMSKYDGEIEKLYDIAVLQDGSFYVFFDKNQFVQGKEFPGWLRNAECRLVLNINCRNTYSIADTSGKPVGVEPKVKNKGVKGDMPKFYICGNRDAALKQISLLIDQYRSNGYAYNQICILTVKTETMSIMQGVERLGVHSIKTARGNSSVLFTTARKFKGLSLTPS